MAAGSGLNTYREGSLHASLKALYARPGDRVEEPVDGYVVDVVRDDELVEIQTSSFASAARKLRRLVESHRLVLVHPIAIEKWLVSVDADGVLAPRRRSPRRGIPLDLFDELVAFPEMMALANFRVELPLVREEEVRGPVPAGARYRYPRHWWRLDRRLLEVVDTIHVRNPADLLGLLPEGLPEVFTSADIATAGRRSRRIGMRATYCLEKAGATSCTGKTGRLKTYAAKPATSASPQAGGAPAARAQ
jgi:hypothetical protein